MGVKEYSEEDYLNTQVYTYREIIEKDCYLFKRWKSDFFDHIIDIGANLGVFTNYAHMRHPKAKIFAYEPFKENFNYLSKKMFMDNVICKSEALGDGGQLVCYSPSELLSCILFYKKGENEHITESSYEAQSISLGGIFKQNNIPPESNYYIKMDCEGGERFLLNDNESIPIIQQACGFGMEVHFPPKSSGRRLLKKWFHPFPGWEKYNEWVRDNFCSTHEIIYHQSNRYCGAGVFVLLSKNRRGQILSCAKCGRLGNFDNEGHFKFRRNPDETIWEGPEHGKRQLLCTNCDNIYPFFFDKSDIPAWVS